MVRRHHQWAHHRTLFNRKGNAAPHCFVQAFTGLLPLVFMGSHSRRGAPVGTHSSQVARNSCGKYPRPLPHPAAGAADLRRGFMACKLVYMAGVRSRAYTTRSPIKIRRLEFIRFTLRGTCEPRAAYRRVRKFRRINSLTRRLSDSREAHRWIILRERCIAIKWPALILWESHPIPL